MSSVSIQPRKVAFDVSSVPRHWNGGDPVLTRFFDALSVHFPEGERFFIQSVRNFKDQVTDDQLFARKVSTGLSMIVSTM